MSNKIILKEVDKLKASEILADESPCPPDIPMATWKIKEDYRVETKFKSIIMDIVIAPLFAAGTLAIIGFVIILLTYFLF